VLTPARLALLLASGNAEVAVGRRPALAILDSGDELAADPASCAPHQIPASNGAMLAALAAPLTSHVLRLGPVPDRMDAMLAALERGGEADVLVTSGGASVGDHDLVRPALEGWGATLDFWRVALRPGKPLLVARRGRQLILGLPGNPVSSFVTAFLFLLPLLRQLGGSGAPLPLPLRLPLARALPANGERTEFLRGEFGPGGVVPSTQQDSSALAALSAANCLVMRPTGAPPAVIGDLADVFPLGNGGNP
jgi:molybdopterin molybdotransferase